MITPVNSHNQDPSQPSRRHAVSANVAARVAGIALSLFGGEEAVAILAQPASASIEHIAQTEQSPRSFMSVFENKLAREMHDMQSSPYFHSIPYSKVVKSAPANLMIEYVGAPSKEYPGHYDWLAVTMNTNEKIPYTLSLDLGTNAKKYGDLFNGLKRHYAWQRTDRWGKLWKNTMTLETDDSTVDSMYAAPYFEVSTEGYPPTYVHNKTVKYSDNPAQVAAAYNAFLAQVHSIVTRR